jgi:hypothetical protein
MARKHTHTHTYTHAHKDRGRGGRRLPPRLLGIDSANAARQPAGKPPPRSLLAGTVQQARRVEIHICTEIRAYTRHATQQI